MRSSIKTVKINRPLQKITPLKPGEKAQNRFEITEEKVSALAQEFLMLGQQHKLEVGELVIVMGLVQDLLAKEIGFSAREFKK